MEEDLIEEILVCLPVKSLCRCKCLSKEWNHFISGNKRFRQRYLNRCNDPELESFLMLGLFVINYDYPTVVPFVPTSTYGTTNMLKTKKRKRNDSEEVDIIIGGLPLIHSDDSLDFDTTHHPPYIVGCSNGFLLCSDVEYLDYLICNPITKHCIRLPPVNFRCERITHGFICHGTSPCLDRVQSYTVMRDTWPAGRGYTTTLTIEILSSDVPEEWEIFILQSSFSFCIYFGAYSAISENGVIYTTAILPNANGQCFLVFDRKTSTESLQLLEFPESTKGQIVFSVMSDGLLACTHWKDDRITIWMLDHRDGLDFTRQWSVKHSAILPRKYGSHVIGCHPSNPLVLFISCYNKTFLYDMKNSRQEVLCSEHLGSGGFEVVPYTYGLVGRHLFLDG